MIDSMFWAQMLSVVFISAGLGLLLNKAGYMAILKEGKTNHFATILAAYLTLLLGMAIVLTHNMWEMSYVGVITLIGWMSVIKGILLFVAPTQVFSIVHEKNVKGWALFGSIFAIVLGAFLAYYGFAV